MCYNIIVYPYMNTKERNEIIVKRSISLLLCLMMVVGLFAGAMPARAASFGVTVTPANAVIEGTGSVDFTVTTILDSIAGQIKDGKDFDLSALVKGFLEEGLSIDALSSLLNEVGFNWEDIVKSLQNNGVGISQIADMLAGMLSGSQLNLEDLVKDLMGDTDLLAMLLSALGNTGFQSDLLNSLLATLQNMDTQGLMEILLSMLGDLGQNSSAKPFAAAAETTMLDSSDLIDAVMALFGDSLSAEQIEALMAMAKSWADSIPLPEAITALKDVLGDDFGLEKAVKLIQDATNGEFNYAELIQTLLNVFDTEVDVAPFVEKFNEFLGTDLTFEQIEASFMDIVNAGFSLDAMKAALDGADLEALFSSLADKLDTGDVDVASLMKALVAALGEQDITDFDFEKFAEAMGEGFDAAAFLQSVVDKISDGEIDMAAVKQAVEEALGEQIDPATVLDMLKRDFGEDVDVVKYVQALFAALRSMNVEIPEMDSIMAIISDKLGTELTSEEVMEIVNALQDLIGGEQDWRTVLKMFGDQVDLTKVTKAINDALGTEMDLNKLTAALMDIIDNGFSLEAFKNALGESVDFDALVASLVDKLDTGDIDVASFVNALVAALEEQDITDFDFSKFAEAMGENFDLSAFLKSVVDKLSDGKIDVDSVKAAIEEALGEQIDLASVIDILKNGLGEDLDIAKLFKALVAGLEAMNIDFDLESVLAKIADEFNMDALTADELTELIAAVQELIGSDMDFKGAIELILNAFAGKIDLDNLFEALQDALGDDFGGMLKDILQALLADGFDFDAILEKLKALGNDPQAIIDLLFGSLITYQWKVRTASGAVAVSAVNDANTYAGADTRTLTVSRDDAPEQDETYVYFCTLTISGKELTSSDGVLVVKAAKAPVEPTTEPTAPVLDNERHIAYITGYEDGTFHPNAQITRAEVAVILYRLLTDASRDVFGTSVNSFTDVPANEWFNTAVSTLAKAQVLTGYPDGTFLPNAPITRAELATVLTRLSVLVNLSREITPVDFSDVADHWAVSFIRTAANNGWINGYDDGTFRPDSSVTRAEAVTMLNRMLDRNPETLPETGMKTFSDNMDPTMWYYLAIQEAANGHTYTRGADGVEIWAEIAA